MTIYKTKLSHFVGAAYLLLFANDVNGFTTIMRTTTTTYPPFPVAPTIMTSKKLTFLYSYQNQKKHDLFRSTCIHNDSNTDDNNEMSQIDVDRKSFLQEIETSMECMDNNNTKKKRRLTNLASSKRGVNVQGIHLFLQKAWKKVKSSFQKPRRKGTSLIATACIMFFVNFTPLTKAFAAPSSGRMGGSFGRTVEARVDHLALNHTHLLPDRLTIGVILVRDIVEDIIHVLLLQSCHIWETNAIILLVE